MARLAATSSELVVGYQEPLFQIRFCDVRCRTLLITAKLIVTLVFQRFIIFQRLRGPHEAHKGKNPTRKTNLAGFSFEAAGGKSAANTPFLPKK